MAEEQEELVVPFCGGCGHLYFSEPKIPLSNAREQAKTRRCHYCHEDEIQAEKEQMRGDRPQDQTWIDPEW